jgi:hypothetical protein
LTLGAKRPPSLVSVPVLVSLAGGAARISQIENPALMTSRMKFNAK